jgi:hypothetical protein
MIIVNLPSRLQSKRFCYNEDVDSQKLEHASLNKGIFAMPLQASVSGERTRKFDLETFGSLVRTMTRLIRRLPSPNSANLVVRR